MGKIILINFLELHVDELSEEEIYVLNGLSNFRTDGTGFDFIVEKSYLLEHFKDIETQIKEHGINRSVFKVEIELYKRILQQMPESINFIWVKFD